MSRCVLDNEETGCEVAIGWDSGLETFFAQVIQSGEEEPSLWRGTSPNEFDSPDELADAIFPFACKVDKDVLIANLLQDKRSNDDRIYSIDDSPIKRRHVPAWDLFGMLLEGQYLRAGATLMVLVVLGTWMLAWLGFKPT